MARKYPSVEKNDKLWKQMKKRLTAIDGIEARVGWFTGQNYGPENQNLPIAMVAMWNEEGHRNGGMFDGTSTPSRPFIRSFFIGLKKSKAFQDFMAHEIKHYIEGGGTSRHLAQRVGRFVQRGIQETVKKWSYRPNSPVTVALKGFNNPLVETGTMAKSVSVKIVREVRNRIV